uniref:Cytochrome b561 domain-containing protein n=1 Tax=Clastoptera arizonana TaxID=38151 RepID=A0A1B6E489_9HEMI
MAEPQKYLWKALLWGTQAVGLLTVLLTIAWVFIFKGGVGWRSEPKLEFNWHTISFTVGMFYLYANGIIVYKAFPHLSKRNLKWIHTGITGAVILCMFFGMLTILDSHNFRTPKKDNWYSLHDWTGIMAMGVFCFQWVFSVYVYLYPASPSTLRMSYKPLHIFLGCAAFLCAVATSLTGFFGKQKKVPNFTKMPPEGLLLNIITVLHVVFAGLVVYIIYDGNTSQMSSGNYGNASTASMSSKKSEE